MAQIQYFLGANSPLGFYSLYDQLSDPKKVKSLYILKGGPGCGKSSLMKRLARHGLTAGYEAEYILCSGDPGSLDGILFPELGTAVVDGTAPHVMEALCPGAVEQYVDLSRFYDKAALQPHLQELLDVTAEYKGHYKTAYRCLGAAGELRRGLLDEVDGGDLPEKLTKRAMGIISRELKKPSGGTGRLDQRFLTAMTHEGEVRLWDTVAAQAQRVYELTDSRGLGHHLLSPILTAALAAGHDVIACPDPMAPKRLAHLILPGLSLALVTAAGHEGYPHRTYRRLRLDAMEAGRKEDRPRNRLTRKMVDTLTAEGVAALSRAKEAHDRLETIYNPHVDFEGVYQASDRLADVIFP